MAPVNQSPARNKNTTTALVRHARVFVLASSYIRKCKIVDVHIDTLYIFHEPNRLHVGGVRNHAIVFSKSHVAYTHVGGHIAPNFCPKFGAAWTDNSNYSLHESLPSGYC